MPQTPCSYKGNSNKKVSELKNFTCFSSICQHLNGGAVVRGTSKGHRLTEHSGKRLWKRKCQNNVSTEKKVTGELICFPELLAGLVVG